jgi:hypothetical protein
MAAGDGRASRRPSRRQASLRDTGLLWMRSVESELIGFRQLGFMESID